MALRLKRRSEVFESDPSSTAVEDAIPDFEDDSNERKARHRIQKRQSIVPTSDDILSSSPSTKVNLTEHYANCIKLSAENKINVKNAFKLRLIDYMTDLVVKKKEMMDNFAVASSALDASAKIYAYRVDSIHTDTLKLAGGVGQSDESRHVENGVENDEDERKSSTTKRSTTKRSSSSTVEKNLKNINVTRFDLEFEVDPLFKKTTSQYDGGGHYFVTSLRIKDDSCELIWDSNAVINVTNVETTIISSNDETTSSLSSLISTSETASLFETVSICPSFESFRFQDWKMEDDDYDLNSSIAFSQSQKRSVVDPERQQEEHVFDVNAPPIQDDLDDNDNDNDDVVDNFEVRDFDVEVNDPEEIDNKKPTSVGFSIKLVDHLSTIPLEYSYFDSHRMGSWLGPKHWKFRQPMIRISNNDNDGDDDGEGGQKRKSSKKVKDEIPPLRFNDLDETSNTTTTISSLLTLQLGPPIKPIQLQLKTMQNWNEEKRTLPDDLRYKGSDLINTDLLGIPPLSIEKTERVEVDNVSDYDFDNRNDVENFCPDDDDDDDDGITTTTTTTTRYEDESTRVNDGLVEAPNRVEKIHIGYAKQAKKMDMKRLKAIEWEILKSKNESEKENEDTTNIQSMSGETTFSNVYKTLGTSSNMPLKMIENLSVPLAFVALLHLCNEHSLHLIPGDELSDFTILQGD